MTRPGKRRRTPGPGWCLLAACAALLFGCERPVAQLEYELLRTLPHDPEAYTQGLLVHEGVLYESTGQYGTSDVRRVDIATGRVLRIHTLGDEHFGEGLALVGDRLVQLTWKAGLAFVYDAATLAPLDTLHYGGEGWGLCHDGQSLFMSDGSGTLQRRDPGTFDLVEEIRVTRDGFSVRNLNELECVGDHVYANIYMKNEIVRIDKVSGEVNGVLDAFSLSVYGGRSTDAGAVFNGIAYDSASGTFYVTGKLWSRMFEIAVSGQ
ncbi:MAG: glutaminyl-peptide cyclotransferase [Gemmatimonadetes bacterium]|nr:glutaminyl-peptide cyclotransferase [Gemmatimonadota bacterium]MYB99465.1 glutaminyl-peptide cyclotransferase [Gemmatimonadota bacterium]MYI45140.1 glutaminyl-peptide cyclotransferase [Gemmatimonadota bacterium]